MLAEQAVIQLYGTSACHLCEQAQSLLESLQAAGLQFEFETRDISESEDLFQRFGLLIPVLISSQGEQLNWPFAPEEVRALLLRSQGTR